MVTAPVQPPADLHQRLVQALRDTAYDCDGHCGLTERECDAQHPIQVAALHHGQVASVYGDIDDLAEVAAAQVQAELAALREQLTAAQAENARLRALLARDHAAAYHQGEPRDGLLWHCGRDHCTAPAAAPTT